MRDQLPCITIRQPFARCVASGHKSVENRGQRTSLRGLVGIHAAKAHDPAGDTDPRVVGLCGPEPRIGQPVGAVIAVAELVDCHLAGPCVNRPAWAGGCHPWGDLDYRNKAAYHLVLADIRALDVPVYARGQLTIGWRLSEALSAQVYAQLGQVPA